MSIKRLSPEELLALDRFAVDEGNPHIVVDKEICARCSKRPCLVVCPARCYQLKDGQVHFEYAGCLECGTCRIACAEIEWHYPRGGYGVQYKCG